MGERLIAERIERAIGQRIIPGAVVAYGADDRAPHLICGGCLDYGQSSPVVERTIYDIASLTKPIATVGCAMRLVERGDLMLDDHVSELLPAVPSDVQIRHLLGHSSGFPAHVEFFRDVTSRDDLFERAAHTPRLHPAGERTVYSDVGFLLLGRALELATGARLDALTRELVSEPLGMSDTRFHPIEEPVPELDRIAPTEECPWRGQLVRGRVHDENAYAAGGVCGHAGLFASAPDLIRFAGAVLDSWSGHGPWASSVVAEFLTTEAIPGSTWRMGWDTPSGVGVSHAGDAWPRSESVGHLAFTGCSLWLFRPRRAYAVILSNRVHPRRENGEGIRELRRDVMDLIAGELKL